MSDQMMQGDGSWQRRLDAGLCPKCKSKTEFMLTPKPQHTRCSVCKLVIYQASTKVQDTMPSEWEPSLHETKLMPSEDDLCSVPEKMYWKDAVSVIENVVEDFLSDADINNNTEERIRAAWKRVLQG